MWFLRTGENMTELAMGQQSAEGVLALAQKIYDEHVSAGKSEPERLISEAEDEALKILTEAEEQANTLLSEASAFTWQRLLRHKNWLIS